MISTGEAVIYILLAILAGVMVNWKVLWLNIQTMFEDIRSGRR